MEKSSRKKVGFFSKIGFKMVLIIALAGAVISAVTMSVSYTHLRAHET